jgi:hypothetical protein
MEVLAVSISEGAGAGSHVNLRDDCGGATRGFQVGRRRLVKVESIRRLVAADKR